MSLRGRSWCVWSVHPVPNGPYADGFPSTALRRARERGASPCQPASTATTSGDTSASPPNGTSPHNPGAVRFHELLRMKIDRPAAFMRTSPRRLPGVSTAQHMNAITPRFRPRHRKRGEPVVRCSREAIVRRPTSTSRGSTRASSGPCSRPAARGTAAESVANHSLAPGSTTRRTPPKRTQALEPLGYESDFPATCALSAHTEGAGSAAESCVYDSGVIATSRWCSVKS